eukprot:7354030-Ditylum_brightwellii.AAC.1
MAEVSKAQEAPDNASMTSAPRIEDAHPEYEEIVENISSMNYDNMDMDCNKASVKEDDSDVVENALIETLTSTSCSGEGKTSQTPTLKLDLNGECTLNEEGLGTNHHIDQIVSSEDGDEELLLNIDLFI